MKYHKLIFFLLLFFLPSQFGYHLWPEWSHVRGVRVDYLSPTLYFTDVLLYALFFFSAIDTKLRQTFLRRAKINKYIFLSLLVYAFINTAVSGNIFLTTYKWISVFKFLFLGMYVYLSDTSLKETTYVFATGVFIIFASVCWQMVFQKSGSGLFYFWGERRFFVNTPSIARQYFLGKEYLRPYAFFPHPNVLAGYLLALVPLFWWLPKSIIKYSCIFLAFMMIVLSASQTVWVSGILLAGASLSKFKLRLSWLIPLAIIFSFLTPLFLAQFLSWGPSIGRRFSLAVISLSMLKSNILTGVGLGNFIPSIFSFYQKLYGVITPETIYWLQPVHNIVLLLAAEAGLVGLLVIYFYLHKALGKNYLDSPLSFSFVAIILTGLNDHYWFTLQQSQLLGVVIVGLLFKQFSLPKKIKSR